MKSTGSVWARPLNQTGVHFLVAALLCLSPGSLLRAQERPAGERSAAGLQSVPLPLPSELEKQNASHVGASADQIREVLTKNPGLLVELKRLIAKQATSHGQVIDDGDLTDQAVFDRLGEDVVFRSEATRLLQRFGYLQPSVNPDSPLGKQEDLVLKERARRLVQIESQEDAGSMTSPRSQDRLQELEQANLCDPGRNVSCPQSPAQRETDGRRQIDESSEGKSDLNTIPRRNAPPANSNSPVLQADLNPERSGGASLSGMDPIDLMRTASMDPSLSSRAIPQSRDALAGAARSGALSSGLLGSLEPGTSGDSGVPLEPDPRRTPSGLSPRRTRDWSAAGAERDSSGGNIVHKANPYSDIPSLFDLYVQVSAHDRVAKRFGLDILRNGVGTSNAIPMDLPVGPDYVVGPGDGLAIDLWGGVSQRMVRVVDREGRVSLPEVGPLLVSGKTLGDIQTTIQQTLRGEFRDVSADVSLSRLRTVRVYVVGEVAEPGAYDISSLSTPLNAVVAAGGITSRGSLRAMKHYRGKELIEEVDAYDLLLRGVGADQKRLENGDSLVIPSAGPLITVEGMVRRPAVYELRGETTLEEALELAGGLLPAAALQHVEVERLVAHQNRTMFSLDLSDKDAGSSASAKLAGFQVQDGDRIHIFPIAPYNDQAIYLEGHVLRPGRYSYRGGMKVSDLVASYADLLPEPAGGYAEIIRLNPPDFRPSVESFDLSAALANPSDAPKLMPLDTIRIFSRYDFQSAPQVVVDGEVRSPGQYATSGQVRLRDAIFLAGGISPDAALDSAQLYRTEKDGTLKILSVNLGGALAGNSSDNLPLESHDRILVHRNSAKVDPPTVYVKGDVANPGRYLLTSNMRVQDLVQLAGGLKPSADTRSAVLTHLDEKADPGLRSESISIPLADVLAGHPDENRILSNGDVLSVRQNPGWNNLGASVVLRGEVMHPGTYGIRPGQSLAEVLQQAGGFTPEAYPYGTVLTRREVRELEMKSHQELIARVKAESMQLRALPENDQEQKDAKLTAIAQTDTALTQLQTNLPLGRVVIHSSQDLKSFDHAALETPLRNGDVILIPKKANYVAVNGQVFNATAVGFVPGRSAKWYLGQAGGVTQLADKKAVFVIRANGSVLAAKNNSTLWSGDPMDAVLLPGDSIVVPERAPRIGSRNWAPLLQSAQVATSVVLAVAYLRP